jgi:hypothetical protein
LCQQCISLLTAVVLEDRSWKFSSFFSPPQSYLDDVRSFRFKYKLHNQFVEFNQKTHKDVDWECNNSIYPPGEKSCLNHIGFHCEHRVFLHSFSCL